MPFKLSISTEDILSMDEPLDNNGLWDALSLSLSFSLWPECVMTLVMGIMFKTLLKFVLITDPFGSGTSNSSRPRWIESDSNDFWVNLCILKICWYSGVSSVWRVGFLYNFNNKLETTTETDENAIAADPIHGCRMMPQFKNRPAAMGIPRML